MSAGVASLAKASSERAIGLVEGGREPQREPRRDFGFDCQVGEDVLHQRRVDEQVPERETMRGMMQSLRNRALHDAGAADRAIEARVLHHLDDHRHAASRFAEQPGVRAVEFDLG